jgi:hypothetical protein
MLETSLLVAAFAIVPELLGRFGIAAPALWRIAGGIFLLVQIPLEFVALRRRRKMPDMTPSRFNVNTINWCLSIGADLIALGLLLNLVGAHLSTGVEGERRK